MSQIVDSDALHPGFFTSSIHLMMKIVFADRENTAVRLCSIELLQIVLHFFAQELRHLNYPVALLGFRSSYDVLPVQPLIRFIDGHRSFFKIKVSRS